MNDKIFITHEGIKNIIENKKVFVFGTGNATELFMEIYKNNINIEAFVDNSENKQKEKYHNRKVISVNELISKRGEEPVIITVFKDEKVIEKQLEQKGLIGGQDFFVWDDLCYFHKDENIKRYIEKMNLWWGKKEEINSNNEILVEVGYANMTTLLTYGQSCVVNHLANKYHASINMFASRMGGRNVSPVVMEIFRSMNAKELIVPELDSVLQKEYELYFDAIWNNLRTWYDWANIKILGIEIGRSLVRDYMRYYVPSFDGKAKEEKVFLQKVVKHIVFWNDYFNKKEVKSVLLIDGVNSASYIRDIAIKRNVPVYIMTGSLQKASLNHCTCTQYHYFDKMWETLTETEKKVAREWGKKHLEERIHGNASDVHSDWDKQNFAFAEKMGERVLDDNDKLKVVICPHSFEEDSCQYGGNLFADNYFLWLCHLGELSEKTNNIDWYLKPHPSGFGRDEAIIKKITNKYNNIKLLPQNVSPLQLKKEGVKYALTVGGSIGHEYPYIGINVINAGENPHQKYSFNISPRTIDEYDKFIINLNNSCGISINKEEMYQFYALNYLIYDWNMFEFSKVFFWEKKYGSTGFVEFMQLEKSIGTWIFGEFLDNMPDDWHNEVVSKIPIIINKIDEWKPQNLYKRQEFVDMVEEISG